MGVYSVVKCLQGKELKSVHLWSCVARRRTLVTEADIMIEGRSAPEARKTGIGIYVYGVWCALIRMGLRVVALCVSVCVCACACLCSCVCTNVGIYVCAY